MKILAVDYGASRTGLAVCDPTEFLTTPITPQITLRPGPRWLPRSAALPRNRRQSSLWWACRSTWTAPRASAREEPQAGQDFADLERPARADVGRAAVHL